MGALFSPEILQAGAVKRLSSWNGNYPQILFIMTGELIGWWFWLVVYFGIHTDHRANNKHREHKSNSYTHERVTYKIISLSLIHI